MAEQRRRGRWIGLNALLPAFQLGVHHGCLTGDCPHQSVNECLSALEEFIAELCEGGLKLISQSRPGFRYFGCECGHEWMQPSRDHLSPSGESCPNCDVWCGATPITMAQYDCLSN